MEDLPRDLAGHGQQTLLDDGRAFSFLQGWFSLGVL